MCKKDNREEDIAESSEKRIPNDWNEEKRVDAKDCSLCQNCCHNSQLECSEVQKKETIRDLGTMRMLRLDLIMVFWIDPHFQSDDDVPTTI